MTANPLTYGVAGLRHLLFGPPPPSLPAPSLPICIAATLLFAAVRLGGRLARRRDPHHRRPAMSTQPPVRTQTAPVKDPASRPASAQRGPNKALLFWLALLLLFGGAFAAWYGLNRLSPGPTPSGQQPAPAVVDYGPPLEHFQLTQSTGQPFDSRRLDGQVWIGSFFYASCPSICRQQNLRNKELAMELGPRGVKFVSITCDAVTDTPSRLTRRGSTVRRRAG